MSITQPISDVINNVANIATTAWQNRLNRKSQEAMNAQNIQAQKDINAQNLANQDYWNRVTMDREDTAWQRASKDIQSSGLSKALLTAGASATPLSTANLIAPRGDAFTGYNASTISGDTVGGISTIAGAIGISNLISKIKDGIDGKRSNSSVPGSTATVDTPTGSVEVSRVDANHSNGYASHYDTRNIPLTKLVASPIDVDHPNGFTVSSNVNSARVSSANTSSSQNALANEASVLSGVLSRDAKERLTKFIKITKATPNANLDLKDGLTNKAAFFGVHKHDYESVVPSLLNPVCAELIQNGVVDNQADAQMYIGNLVYTIHTDDSPSKPTKEALEKMLGADLFPNHYGASQVGYYKRNFPSKKDFKYYIKGGANGAKYNSHD